MGYVQKVIGDIFSMGFDIVIPVSGNIIAILVALTLFFMRYTSFRHKIKKYGSKSRHGKLKPRRMPVLLPQVQTAKTCDRDIAAFLMEAVNLRVNEKEMGRNRQVDCSFGGAFGAEILRRTPDMQPVPVETERK